MLLEDIAGLEREPPIESESGEPSDPALSFRRLARARRRAIAVIALDWAALLILVLARAGSGAYFAVGPTEDGIFALGLLAIAVHSGFRLGQLEKLEAVRRVLDDLASRSQPGGDPPESP